MPITAKQQRFCDEYLVDLNATQAAIRAGYSVKTAAEQSSRLLTNVKIQEYVSQAQKKVSENLNITVESILNELRKIGFSNIHDYIEEGNVIVDLKTIDRDKAAAVSSIKKSTTEFGDEENGGKKTTVEFKLWDKISALEKMGKHLGMFGDKLDVTSKGLPINLINKVEIVHTQKRNEA